MLLVNEEANIKIYIQYEYITGMFLESYASYLFISLKLYKNCKNSERLCQLLTKVSRLPS